MTQNLTTEPYIAGSDAAVVNQTALNCFATAEANVFASDKLNIEPEASHRPVNDVLIKIKVGAKTIKKMYFVQKRWFDLNFNGDKLKNLFPAFFVIDGIFNFEDRELNQTLSDYYLILPVRSIKQTAFGSAIVSFTGVSAPEIPEHRSRRNSIISSMRVLFGCFFGDYITAFEDLTCIRATNVNSNKCTKLYKEHSETIHKYINDLLVW